jgi:ElaB/YqjD/DUF883 family membrane-anchored ribosome-binding protein
MESSQQTSPQDQPASTEQGTSLVADARHTLSSAAESVRGRAGNLQAQLADALDSGASVLRQRSAALAPTDAADGASGASGSASGVAAVVEQAGPQIAAQGEMAANLMERGATWLRETDLSELEGRLLGQLERNPIRTLGIAAAVGFLVAGRRR